MGFSMPSYGSSISGDKVKLSSGGGAPSFNPFGDFQPGFVDEDKKEEERQAKEAAEAEKAAAEAQKAEDRKAAAARKDANLQIFGR